jgi:hypothetical protein
MATTMDIEAFLKRENIPFMYLRNEWDDMNTLTTDEISKWSQLGIRLVIKPNPDGTQKKIHIPNFKKTTLSKWVSVFLKHTDVFCLDIDDKEFDIKNLPEPFQSMPYTLSRNSKLRHCFFRSNCPEYSQEVEVFKHCKADLIHYKKNMWEVIGWEIQQYNGELPYINWNDIKSHFDIKKMNFNIKPQGEEECSAKEEDTESVCSQATTSSVVKDDFMYIKKELADNYDSWFKLACIAKFNDIDYEIFDEWSRQSPKYNEKKNRDIWDKIKLKECIRKDVGKAVLNKYIKQGKQEEAKKEAIEGKIVVNNDIEGVNIIYESLKKADCVVYTGDTYYIKNGNLWESKPKVAKGMLRNYISEFDIVKNTGEDKIKDFSKNLSEIPKIIEQIMAKLIRDKNVKFTDKFRNTTLGKICFDNGVLDFKTKEFKLWSDCPDVYTKHTTGRNYIKCDNIELQNKIKNDIFKNTFGEKDYLRALHFFSRAIAGHTTDKVWGLFVASRDIGKSVLMNYLQNSFGHKYITVLNSSSLLESNDSQDADKANQWMFKLEDARITFSSESKCSKQKIDGMKIKQISSGYDSLSARHMAEEAITFRPSSILFMMANDVCSFNTEDTFKNVCSFTNNKSFVSKEEMDTRREQGASSEELDTYLIKDDDIENKISSDEYINALYQILLDNYTDKPIEKVNVFTDSEGKIENLHTFIEKYIHFTKNENDFVSVKKLDDLCKNEMFISYRMKLRPYLKDVRKCNVEAQKRVNGLKCKGVSGIKLVVEAVDVDDEDKPEIEI